MGSLRAVWKEKSGLRFCLLFAAWLGMMAICFEWLRPQLANIYMYPISHAAAFTLEVLGIEARLGPLYLPAGGCELAVAGGGHQGPVERTGDF